MPSWNTLWVDPVKDPYTWVSTFGILFYNDLTVILREAFNVSSVTHSQHPFHKEPKEELLKKGYKSSKHRSNKQKIKNDLEKNKKQNTRLEKKNINKIGTPIPEGEQT